MADLSFLHYKCINSACQKTFPVKRVAQGGLFSVSCPYCQNKQYVRMPPMPVGQKEQITEPVPPDFSQAEPKPTGIVLKTNECADITCPHCGGTVHFEGSDKPILSKILPCKVCKGPMTLKIISKTKIILPTNPTTHRGKLHVANFFLFKKEFSLKIGKNIIGRRDKDFPSDIEFEDHTMSRKSVNLEVIYKNGGYHFLLKVLNATNPVLVNNQEFHIGDSVYLNYGDVFILGQTTIRFVKA